MCGRVFVKAGGAELLARFAFARDESGTAGRLPPRYNGAPGLDYPLIVREPDMPGARFVLARWGFVPRWAKGGMRGPRPINAKAETVATNGMFKAAYRSRRALMPIHGFFEWRAIRGQKTKQPYAIAMMDGKPFCLAAVWEAWRDPESGTDIRTFAVVTCPANELVGRIHDRMPVIVAEADYARWLGDEPEPGGLLRPYPADMMAIWPVSRRVNSPANDDSSVLDPSGEA